jgi:alkylation response protein AidB-like acyl-CoA dehydrogenase
MHTYQAPLRDLNFVLFEFLQVQNLAKVMPAYADASQDVVSAILEEGGKFCSNILQPLNGVGDEEGCRLENGVVRTPNGFKQAYQDFVAAGWPGLACDAEFGGQGLTSPVSFAFEEMLSATNMAFGLWPLLTHSAYHALRAHGTEDQKQTYLPKMVSGEWPGTMNLTEPHCGTDLGLLKTKAIPQDDGSYKLQGTKIFITAGDHDLAENIVHLVLARLPDAPAGVKGISLFVCPKFLPKPDGSLGMRNNVSCGALEKKMGIHGAPTCVMNYDGATAWMVGQPHKGLSAMFTMMNAARLAVGIQGLGIGEAAYQSATSYAKSRLQMRAPTGAKHPDKPADPIIVHPDVRRMLMRMRAMNEGCRALATWMALELDISTLHPDEQRRQQAKDLVALMTPVVKSMLTDQGFSAANDAVQVHGGHGYIRDWGAEQLVRDARITQIYEGTNGIQALDLVARKLVADDGKMMQQFMMMLDQYLTENKANPLCVALARATDDLKRTTAWLKQVAPSDANEAPAAATDYLRLFGLVAIGFMWAQMADKAAASSDQFYVDKIKTAQFFMSRILPETSSLATTIMSGAGTVMAISDF